MKHKIVSVITFDPPLWRCVEVGIKTHSSVRLSVHQRGSIGTIPCRDLDLGPYFKVKFVAVWGGGTLLPICLLYVFLKACIT